jgi:hypothetical protein
MRLTRVFAAGFLGALCALAQSGGFQINSETPEGKLLQQAGQESDEAKQLAMYEEFIAKYPKHEGVPYAYNHLQPLLLKAKQLDKVLAAADIILAAEPDNSVAAYNALQACEQKSDAACIALWSGRTVDAARKKLATKKPVDEEAAEVWTREIDYAKQVITRCEYAYYAGALKFPDPKSIVDLYEALERTNPESQYIAPAGARYLVALLQLKELTKAQAYGEKAADKNQANEDTLLFIADANLSTSKDYDKAIRYAGQLVATLPAQAAPQGMAPEAWAAKRDAALARAYWIQGTAYGVKEDWTACEKALRAGLPLIEGIPAGKDLLPGAYFYLGLSNYNLSKVTAKRDPARTADARKYFTACSKIPGPFQQPAVKNLNAMTAGK